jgi:hypothetical protein
MTAVKRRVRVFVRQPCQSCGGPKPGGIGRRFCDPCAGKGSQPWLTANGYLQVKMPGHPVARANGYAFVHRIVLYNAIGPGTHACHHCGKAVTWFDPNPLGLVVDHLDFNRTNNALTNLAASCHSCNSGRGGNGLKRACPSGHPYDEANTRMYRGHRYCRACLHLSNRARKARIAEAAR